MKNYGFVIFFLFVLHEPLHILQLSNGEPHSQLSQVTDEKGQGGKQWIFKRKLWSKLVMEGGDT